MNCTDYQLLIGQQLDGELSAAKAERVAQHLATCESCRREEARLATTRGLLGALPNGPGGSDARAALQVLLRSVPTDAAASASDHLAGGWLPVEALLGAVEPVAPPAALRGQVAARLQGAVPVAELSCDEVQPLLSERVDGHTSEAVEVHLANCRPCLDFALTLEDQHALLASTPVAPGAEAAKDQLRSRLAAFQQSRLLLLTALVHRHRRAMLAFGVATCALVFGALGVFRRAPVPESQPARTARSAPAPTVQPVSAPEVERSESIPAPSTDSLTPEGSSVSPSTVRVATVAPGAHRRSAASAAERPPSPRSPVTEAEASETPEPKPESATTKPATEEATPAPDWEKQLGELETMYAHMTRPREGNATTPAPEATAPTPARVPTTPSTPVVYVDESPRSAPAGSATPGTQPETGGTRNFEAPPAETRVVRAPEPSPERDVLAEIRQKLQENRRRFVRTAPPLPKDQRKPKADEIKLMVKEFDW